MRPRSGPCAVRRGGGWPFKSRVPVPGGRSAPGKPTRGSPKLGRDVVGVQDREGDSSRSESGWFSLRPPSETSPPTTLRVGDRGSRVRLPPTPQRKEMVSMRARGAALWVLISFFLPGIGCFIPESRGERERRVGSAVPWRPSPAPTAYL